MARNEPRARRVGLADGERTSSPRRPHADAQTATVFRFAFTEPRRAKDSIQRREAVADYLAAWEGAAILAEQREGGRCWVWLRLARPADVAGTGEFLSECPHYVPRSFKVVSG